MMLRALILGIVLLLPMSSASAASPPRLGQGALGNIFVAGEAIAIPVRSDGETLRWSVRDFFGAEVASGVERISGGAAVIQPRLSALGYFTLEATAGAASRAQTAFAVVPLPKPARSTSPFGVMTHFAKGWATDIIPLIERAGIRHVRDEQPWRLVERQRGQYAFPPRLSAYMSELSARNIDALIVLAFSNPLYDQDQTPYSDAGRAGYAAYAQAVAGRYAPSLTAVEIWNEYNGSFCQGPCRADRPAYYTRMLQDTHRALKAANPSLTILGGAAVPIPLDYYRSLFQKGALDALDAVVIHPYRRQPEGVEQQIEALRRLMAQHGTEKPIWATEFADLADMRKSRDDVARYLVRMSTLLLSARVERIYWYLMRDYQEFTGIGLVRDEADPLGRYAPTPAYAAYATLIYQLDGARFLRREPSTPEARVYLFADETREIRVLWSDMDGAAYTFESNAPVHRVSITGGEGEMAPREGKITVALDRNPIYLVSRKQ